MVGGRNSAIDRLLKDDFLDVIGGEIPLGQRRPHVHAELLPLIERKHGTNDQNAARALVVVGARPYFAPGGARDEILKLFVECGLPGICTINPGIAEHLAAPSHSALVALLVVHCNLRQARRKLRTVSVYCSGTSTF